MKRNDNRGASFVMVVVAMAIVAVLAVTVLWIALMNLQMKVTDEKNTDNFYSAEGVEIIDPYCCRKTFENFYEVLEESVY